MSRSDLNISRWLEAHSDRSAGLVTISKNAILSDVTGNGEHYLVLTDLRLEKDSKCRLKVYKGTILTSDQILPNIPSSLISFYNDRIEPRIPVVAVACCSDLLMYKNNKPFFKFSTPSTSIMPLEQEIWKNFTEDPGSDIRNGIDSLKAISYNLLTPRSQELLNLLPLKQEEYVRRYLNSEPVKCSPIVCMATLKKTSQDKFSISCPVLATESGVIYILDPQNFTILHQANVTNFKTTPSMILATGLYEVDFRIVMVTRQNQICILRRGWLEGKLLVQLTTDIVDIIIIPGDNFNIVATTDKRLHCYTKKGQRLWSCEMIASISCLCLIPLKQWSTHLIAVGLTGGPIHFYQGRRPVDYISAPDTPSCITFGKMGQEEHVMIIITLNGSIVFKILKRTADFNLSHQEGIVAPISQGKPLPLPKRSKLFLEQSMRERENPIDMHLNFQQDLIRLRLTAARALVQNLSDHSGIGNEHEQIKLSAQVLGLGPKFTLILSLDNMNTEKPAAGLTVIFHVKPTSYILSSYVSKVPLVPPGLSYKIETKVNEVRDTASSDEMAVPSYQVVRVFVIRKEQTRPVLAATINMPPTEFI